MDMKLSRIIKQTDNKFLNMFVAEYGEKTKYFFASRRSDKDLQKSNFVDAVKVLPYIKETNEIVFIKNFRYVVNDFVYEMPAGLVDGGESSIDGARREVEEEIGATVLNIEKITNVGFTSVGLTDETMETYFAEVVLDKSQNLDEDEIIDIVRVNVDDIDEFLNTHLVDCITALMVKLFVSKLNRK